MNHLICRNKKILYYLGIVIIFWVILIYQPGFYPDIIIEASAQSNTNKISNEPNSEKDLP